MEKSRPSESGRRVIGVTRWEGLSALHVSRANRSSPSQSHPSGCYIAIISPVTRAGIAATLNEPGKCSACRALAPPSVGWGFLSVPCTIAPFSDRPKLLVSAILLSRSRRSLLRWWQARDGIPVLIIDCE